MVSRGGSTVVTFTVLGEDQVARELLIKGERGGNLQPVFNVIADDWMMIEQEQFASQGARGSGGWPELKPSTVKSKGHDAILIDSGDLYREMTDRSNIMITDDFMHFAPADEQEEIGRYHQTGTSRMPQRKVVDFTDLDRRAMVRKVQSWIVSGVLI